MEIPNDSDDTVSSSSGEPWYLYDGGWDRIDLLGIQREWAHHNPAPAGWPRLYQPEELPIEARRVTIEALDQHAITQQRVLDSTTEQQAWERQSRILTGPTPRSLSIVDQVGGWGRIDRLGISRQWVRDNPAPEGWLLWEPDDVPHHARRGSNEEPRDVNPNRYSDDRDRRFSMRYRDMQYQQWQVRPWVNQNQPEEGNRRLWVNQNQPEPEEEGKRRGGTVQHEHTEQMERRRRRRLVEVTRREENARHVDYLERRGVFLIHATMPSSIYSNTTVEASQLSGATINTMEIETDVGEQTEERRMMRQRNMEVARQEEVDSEDEYLEERGVFLIRATMPVTISNIREEVSSELSDMTTSEMKEDSEDDRLCG